MSNIYGRQVVLALTNKSGGSVIAGDVVVVDTGNNEAFTTSTAGAVTGGVGIAQEAIANNASGRVLVEGYAALVNTSASVTRGNYGKTHTVAKQAVDAGASRVAGTFCQFLIGGTTPSARLFPPDLGAAAGNVAVDAIWDAKGDLAGGTGADTAARLAVGANDLGLVADSTQSTGLKWGRAIGTILAAICYGNSSDTKTTTSTSAADADATNLAVTFSAPASGIVLVRLTAGASADSGAGGLIGDYYTWGLRESTTNIAGLAIIQRLPVAGATVNLYSGCSMVFKITGLTAGSSHTYKWAHAVNNARTTGTLLTQAASPATMEIIAL